MTDLDRRLWQTRAERAEADLAAMTKERDLLQQRIDGGLDTASAPLYIEQVEDTVRVLSGLLAAANARILELTNANIGIAEERDRLQHIIDCADTPLMRDVMRERDEAREDARKWEWVAREQVRLYGHHKQGEWLDCCQRSLMCVLARYQPEEGK